VSLIVAIEPDRRQADVLAGVARGSLGAELVVADSTRAAVKALGDRIPDLILTSLLLSPKDESALADRLRELDAAGIRVQTLVIPVFAVTPRRALSARRGLLTRLRGAQQETAHEGCDPAVFGAQVREYLDRIAAERAAAAVAALEDSQFMEPASPPSPSPHEQEPEPAQHGFEVESEWYPTVLPPEAEATAPSSIPPNAFEMPFESHPSAAPPPEVSREPQRPDVRDQHAAAEVATPRVAEGDADLMAFVAQLEREITTAGDAPAGAREASEPRAGGVTDLPANDVMRLDMPEIDIDFSEWLDEASAMPQVVSAVSNDPLPDLEIEVPLALEADADLVEFFAVDEDPLMCDRAAGFETPRSAASEPPAVEAVSIPAPGVPGAEADAVPTPLQAAPPEPDAPPALRTTDTQPPPESPELLGLLTAIKRDIEQLRAGLPLSTPGSPAVSETEPAPKKRGRTKKKKPLKERWGFFDPKQSGFSALVEKLDEIAKIN
jgi:hypothetical protein